MCGIVGTINFNGEPVAPALLKKMTDIISHRGPDDEGQWIDGPIGLGHRRLSIIDLSAAGHQPMLSHNQRFILTYNGELYNFCELRAELEALGHRFQSQTDSEVVLYALIEWGSDALIKFNGMFALAFWDCSEKKLLLARDRYGIKPLYYTKQGNLFAFGSEQKAITVLPNFRKSANKAALLEYFTFQNIFTDQTLMNDVSMLPAGHFMEVDIRDIGMPKLRTKQYWDYNFRQPDVVASKEEYIEELDRLFKQAVGRQLVGDVELGSYLSGGMDSGSITAIAAQKFPNLKTFTCGFDLSSASGIELGFDERAKAEAMSAQFRTEQYEMVLKSGDMERCLPDLVWHLEEPRVGQSYPNYFAAKLASKFVKVVLSGAGGDELFGGYPWRYYQTATSKSFDEYIDGYYLYWHRLVNNTQIRELFAPISKDIQHVWTKNIFQNVFSSHDNKLEKAEDYINHSLYFEAKTFLHGLLVVEDKLSMAHSLETRVPFLDNDLVDFAMSCPVQLKINGLKNLIKIDENNIQKKRNYFKKTNDGKQILREVMKSYIPDEVTQREKQGFSSPDASWFKGESIEFVKNEILNKNEPIFEFLDYETTQNIAAEHFSGEKNRRLFVWSLINVNQYLKIAL